LAVFLLINGILLYIPQYFSSGNKDSRTLSRVEGLLMGLGGTASVIPGISAMGVTTSIGSLCGVDRSYCLNLTLMMNLFLNVGFAVYDVMGILSSGIGAISVLILLRYLMTAAIAFGGAMMGIRLMRQFAENNGYAVFGFYSFGQALFTFILNLMA
jgi:undecaprenyl pyrophosphate phosphatase UppP